MGVPKRGVRSMPKSEKWPKKLRWPPIKKLHKIKVVGDPQKWGTGWGQIWPPRLHKAKIEVASFHAYHWTNPYQNLHGLLFFNGDRHGEVRFFIGVPKRGAHFMPKIKNGVPIKSPPIKKLHKIKVVWDPPKWWPDEVRSDLQGCMRPKLRSPHFMLIVGPILTKICAWCSFSMGSDIGESNFL